MTILKFNSILRYKMALNTEEFELYKRIECYISKTDSCWLWTKCTTAAGYGCVRIKGQFYYIHKLMYHLFVNKLYNGVVRHKCDNPACCNPEHLESGSQQENVNDMWIRNRAKPQGKTPMTLETYELIIDRVTKGERIVDLAEEYRRDRVVISAIANGYYKPYLKLKS
jgi:hypothetical protein